MADSIQRVTKSSLYQYRRGMTVDNGMMLAAYDYEEDFPDQTKIRRLKDLAIELEFKIPTKYLEKHMGSHLD